MEYLDYIYTHLDEIFDQIKEHLWLTGISIILASIVGVCVGVLITRYTKFSTFFLGITSTIQTIPSLALLGFLLPIFGIGAVPAIIALFLYALLPIVRNTFTGIQDIEPAIKQAAIGMGLTDSQVLFKVELPLALPVIFAGIRTASVITVGIATLCALIGAGGLGELIFRGISLNNPKMIIAGALPASLLALLIDGGLSIIQKNMKMANVRWLILLLVVFISIGIFLSKDSQTESGELVAGFNSEFIERADGYLGLNEIYDLNIDIREMEIGLMYSALRNGEVDVIDGFSTDGRIKAYDLKSLQDDQHYFPPYHAAPIVNITALRKYPQLTKILGLMDNLISEEEMMEMNYQVDHKQRLPEDVAKEFLINKGFTISNQKKKQDPELVIGSKSFTESYILAHLMKQLINSNTSLSVDLRLGFGGTKIIFDALSTEGIDMYPEYTGTGLLVLLQTPDSTINILGQDKNEVYQYVKHQFMEKHKIHWMPPFGFNNTFALMMRRDHADSLKIESISDLSRHLRGQ